jgi:hypothetical protein
MTVDDASGPAGADEPAAPNRFSRLRLSGGRYDATGFPLEALPELVRYERLVLDVARTLWKREHPSAGRLPNKFVASLSLRLTQILPGSTVPLLDRIPTQDSIPEVDAVGLIDRAQDLVDKAFAEIITNNTLPQEFPNDLTSHFLRLGSTLQGSEGMQFGPPAERSGKYTQAIRGRFLTQQTTRDFSRDGTLVGRVTALDTDALTFSVRTLDGQLVQGQYADESLTEDLRAVFNAASKAPIVRIDGTQIVSPQEGLKSIDDVREIEVLVLAEGRHAARFEELLSLSDGWNGAGSKALDFTVIDRAVNVLTRLEAAGVREPGIFALPDGGIQLEWMLPREVWGIDILVDQDEIEASVIDVSTQESDDISTTSPDAVVDFISKHDGEAA